MHIKGRLKKDRKTKNLTKRLKPGDIALIAHKDLDEIAALSLVEKKMADILIKVHLYYLTRIYPSLK